MPSKELAEIVADNLKRPLSERVLAARAVWSAKSDPFGDSTNDCFWPFADVETPLSIHPLSGVKRS